MVPHPAEVDLVLEGTFGLVAVEVKHTSGAGLLRHPTEPAFRTFAVPARPMSEMSDT